MVNHMKSNDTKLDTAVILVAGKSERCYPLTLTRPKPLLEFAGTTILEYTLGQLKGLLKRVILVVGYKQEMVKKRIGERWKALKIEYVTQTEQLGTAHAVLSAKSLLKGGFLLLNGDDIYHREDLARLMKQKRGILVMEHEHPERFGVVEVAGKTVMSFAEKPEQPAGNLVNCGAYLLDEAVFTFLGKTRRSLRGEYELTTALNDYCDKFKMQAVAAKQYWIPIGYPWNLLDANELLLSQMKNSKAGKIEQGVHIEGTLILGKGSIIKSGTYIEGPVCIGENCTVGPNAYLRKNVTLGDNCKVGQAVEIKNTILFSGSKIPHLSYVGDSVIGSDVNLGAGTITANLRHDNANVKSLVKGVIIDSGRRKFGTIIGDGTKTGIKTMIYPGRKLWPNTTTLPGEVVTKDVM